MKILKLSFLAWCLVVCGPARPSSAGEDPTTKSGAPDADKTMARLSQLIGGTWVNVDPRFVVEFRYDWAFGKKAIRGLGVIDKGGPHETPGEAIIGWDNVNKTVYYLDCHGGNNVFKGTVKLEGDDLIFEFATIIGTPARWREVLTFPDSDTMHFTIFREKEGKWSPFVEQTSKRRQPQTGVNQLVTEGHRRRPGRRSVGSPGHQRGTGVVERSPRRDRAEGRRQDAPRTMIPKAGSVTRTPSRTPFSASNRIECSRSR